ncbi:MAG: glycosyltransferase family 4 protein [Thaumarchaeota archaeon]|nr:MAG: glycosyltransferase family 4 protein [Nitrososphaerota archaeon]
MNIFIVGEYYSPNLIGGAEVQAMMRAEGLARMGHKVRVVSFDSNKGTTIEETINGVRVTRYPIRTHKAKMLALSMPVAQALRKHEHEADIYHLYNTHPLAGGGLYKVSGGKKKVIATLENYGGFCPVSTAMSGNCDFLCRYSCLSRSSITTVEKVIAFPYASAYPFIELLSKELDGYIAVSEYVRKKYVQHGFNPDKIKVLPNSIDIKEYYKQPKVEHSGINILYVGRMSREKGVDVLIRAFKRISETYDHARLVLVGSGPLLESYIALARELGIRDKVTFTGHASNEIREYYYSIADVFVHPALWHEPFGMTLLEAMAHEVPVVVSDVGSLSQLVKDAGLVFDSGSVESLTNQLAYLIGDRNRINDLLARCKSVVTDYSDDEILETLAQIYESMINNG